MIFLLILLIPTQFRYHFWPAYSFIQGIKVDYLSIHLSLFDVAWLLVFVLALKRPLPWRMARRGLMKGLVFVFVVFLNLLFSRLPINSFYKYFQLFQAISLYWLLVNLPDQKRVWVIVKNALVVGLFLTCLLAVWQFVRNGSVGGLWYYLGERTFSVTTPGISTFMLWGREHIRPYSFFSHPNSLAGYLGASLLVVSMPTLLKLMVLFVLLLTNSWNALIALFIVLLFKKAVLKRPLVLKKASALLRQGDCLMKFVVLAFLFSNLLFFTLSWFLAPDVLVSAQRGLAGRLFLTKEVLTQAVSFLPFGLGAGNEVLATVQSNFFWTPQPVHNLLLIGFIDFGLLLFVICYLLFEFLRKLSNNSKGWELAIFVLLTGMFDHYWWTLSQNLLLIPVLLYIIKNDD